MASNTHKYVAKEGSRNFFCRRAPHGARGLKQNAACYPDQERRSRPARGAWIETCYRTRHDIAAVSRAPHGARGLKLSKKEQPTLEKRRAPHGARGLKHMNESLTGLEAGRAPHGARGLKLG